MKTFRFRLKNFLINVLDKFSLDLLMEIFLLIQNWQILLASKLLKQGIEEGAAQL